MTADKYEIQYKDHNDKQRIKTMKTENKIPERYYLFNYDFEEVDLVEVDKEVFEEEEGEVTMERHTMFTNGVDQICYTKGGH